jgi:hypothetical protein|nr:MAG TPA_asm: hypothetical protein [Caudoviricetes sp.]
MKLDKVKLISMIAMGIGFIGTVISNKADEMAREQMRDEIKDEVLTELKGDE